MRQSSGSCGRLISAMGHAVRAFFVAAGAISVPVRRIHQFGKRAYITLAEQVAGLLPSENIPRRHAPRGTMIRLVAGEKIEEQGGMHQVPALAPAEREDAAEQLLGFAAAEKMLLVGRPLVGIAGRN